MWGKKPDAQMTEEEKKAAEAQSKAEMDALVERLGASIEQRFSGKLEESLKPIREKVEMFESSLRAPAKKPEEQKEPADPITEPDRWKQENLLPLAMQNILLRAEVIEQRILDRVEPNWQHLIPEVKKYLQGTPPERKAQQDYSEYVQNCVDLAIGRAAKAAGVKYNSKDQRFFIEDGGTGTSGNENSFSDDVSWIDRRGRRMSGEEQLARLGIDPKEFKAGVA